MILHKKTLFPLFVVSLLIGFIAVTWYVTKYYAKEGSSVIIARDIAQLRDIFNRIHKTCGIIDFDYQKNQINFLNVKEFTGSEVGPMNLVYPDKWEGPYLEDNPTMQAKEYQIVETKKGYFITPGKGVKLPNGKVIGKDIILDKDADILLMMEDPHKLMYNGTALAAPLEIGSQMGFQVQFAEDY